MMSEEKQQLLTDLREAYIKVQKMEVTDEEFIVMVVGLCEEYRNRKPVVPLGVQVGDNINKWGDKAG